MNEQFSRAELPIIICMPIYKALMGWKESLPIGTIWRALDTQQSKIYYYLLRCDSWNWTANAFYCGILAGHFEQRHVIAIGKNALSNNSAIYFGNDGSPHGIFIIELKWVKNTNRLECAPHRPHHGCTHTYRPYITIRSIRTGIVLVKYSTWHSDWILIHGMADKNKSTWSAVKTRLVYVKICAVFASDEIRSMWWNIIHFSKSFIGFHSSQLPWIIEK